jgi:hypothetical protein
MDISFLRFNITKRDIDGQCSSRHFPAWSGEYSYVIQLCATKAFMAEYHASAASGIGEFEVVIC